jgi:hypothetical protein
MNIDYQGTVTLALAFITMALPIGIVFGITEKLLRMFLSAVTGEKNIKM